MSLFLKQLRDLRIPNPFGGGSSTPTVATGLTAAGTNQATALELAADINLVENGLGGQAGVRLPSSTPIGKSVTVAFGYNTSPTAIYPPVGHKFIGNGELDNESYNGFWSGTNGYLGIGTSQSSPNTKNGSWTFTRIDSTRWMQTAGGPLALTNQ